MASGALFAFVGVGVEESRGCTSDTGGPIVIRQGVRAMAKLGSRAQSLSFGASFTKICFSVGN